MSLIWQSYIPYHVAQDLALHPQANPVGREQRFEVVALFADISGFTAFSEALAATGKSGAEELTAILNSYFGPMIELIQSYGGIIGKFGGDAMMALFPYEPADHAVVTRRAIQCALDMQERMVDYISIPTSAGALNLAMKAGLAAGPVFCTTVGDPATRLEYIIAGSALDRCAQAEHHATRKEVVVHNGLLEAVGEAVLVEERGEFSCITRLKQPGGRAPLPPLDQFTPEAVQTVAAYMHPSIAQRLREGQTSFINEHRQVTVLFANFGGFDYDDDPDVGDKLQTYLSRVIRIVQSYDGYLNRVDMGDKGSKAIVLFGAPIAHEDDEERALRCALELRDLPGAPARIGINTGFVYCGQVGSAVRQEYTVMGDAVNLAARLMQAARPGQILVSEATYSDDVRSFAWGSGAVLRVKGKSAPVGAYTLVGMERPGGIHLQEPEYTLPMVGREAELQVAQERLERVLQSQGQIIGITAQAGMGKSRLAAEIVELAAERGFTGYGGECLSYGVNTSYLVWQNLLRGFFGLDPSWPLEAQLSHLEVELAALDPDLVQRMPLLGRPLNLPIPENELTRSLDAKVRKTLLEALLVDCLRLRARGRPLLLVLEDCHWIDPLSNDLMETIGRNIADVPALMLVIYRPPETEHIQPRVTRFAHFGEIRLAEFNRREAERLIGLKLTQLFGALGSVPAEFVERITERSQGNPFYIDEMINLLHDQGIDPADLQTLGTLDLPDSLRSLIISRIDQLAEETKTTLKVASVIGRLFKAGWLWGAYPPLGAPERVIEQLAQLSRLDITPLDKPEPELEYLFKHIVTREVAYESLALATRTMLHERIGEFIERAYPEELDRYVDLLAHHYGLSQNVRKQREYFRRAGKAAQEAYANQAAVEYYQRLLPLLMVEEKSQVMLELGQVWRLTGQWDQAEEIYQQSLELAGYARERRTFPRCERAMGTLLRLQGKYEGALDWLERARNDFEVLDDQAGLCDSLREIGVVLWSQGNYSGALQCYQQSQQVAQELGDQRRIYRAVGNMGIVYMEQGDYSQALACYEQCHQAAAGLSDRVGVSIAVGNMGNVYLDQGNYPRALDCHAQNLQIALEIGYRQGVSISVGNMGDVYLNYGDYSQARTCLVYNLHIALEIGDILGIGFTTWNMAKVCLTQRSYEEAGRLLIQAIALGRALDTPYELCDYLYTHADLCACQEQFAAAQPLNDEALRIATEVDHKDVQFKAQVLAVRLRAALGQVGPPAAIGELESLLEAWPADPRQAAVQYEIWRLDPEQESRRQAAAGLYRALYAQTPNIKYKQRYEELTGEQLPDPLPLPPLPEIVTREPADLEALLTQFDTLVNELGDFQI